MSARRIVVAVVAAALLASCRTTRSSEVNALLGKSTAELDQLFLSSPPGLIPNGEAAGTAIVDPGTPQSPEIANFITTFGWKGKVFDAANGTLVNRLGVTGTEGILAKVSVGKSLIDGKDCIVLDYSKTSVVAHHVRDEIRLIGPDTYFGPVYWDDKKLFYFALQF
jgi:hypothetical protein